MTGIILPTGKMVLTERFQGSKLTKYFTHAGSALVLYGLSKQIANCYSRADECRERAALSASESERKFYTDRKQGWLKLARSYELSERVARFVNELQRRNRLMPKPAKARLTCPSCAVAMRF